MKKKPAAGKTNCWQIVAEMERFELSQALTPLPHFECGPFNHLGTSPHLSQHQLLPGKRGELMGRTDEIIK